MLTVTNKTGSHSLNWSLPATVVKDMEEGSTVSYDAQIIPDTTVFSTGNGDNVLLNMGKGSEPGMGQDKNTNTDSSDTGAISGYPYPNNDWTRAIIKRYRPSTETHIPPGTHYIPLWDKTLDHPYTPGKTVFDPESLDYAKASSNQQVDHYAGTDGIASGTQVKTTLTMMPAGADLLDFGYHPYMKDTWDPKQQQWEGGFTLT